MSIARAVLILMLGHVGSRVLGMVRELVIAALFGASSLTDAFTAAARVPTTFYDLLVGGMISAALVPVFSGLAEKGEAEELWRLSRALFTLLSLGLLTTVVVLIFLAPELMEIFSYGFPPQTRDLSVTLVRLMLPALLFTGLAGLFTALLYARRRFLLPAMCLSAYNLGIILGALLLHPFLGVRSLVVGVLAGAFLQAALQLPGLWEGVRRFRPALKHPGLGLIFRLYLPVLLGLVVSAVGIAIDSNLASRTGEGNMAAMRFATTLVQFPLGLVAAAVSFALLPTLSRYASASSAPTPSREAGLTHPGPGPAGTLSLEPTEPLPGQRPGPLNPPLPRPAQEPPLGLTAPTAGLFPEYLTRGLRFIFLVTLPATVALAVLRVPAIQILFQRGAFDAQATARTAIAFLAYAPGLPAAAVDQLLIFAFYARQKTLTPVLVGVLGVLIYLLVGISLLGPLGMPGLALANSAQWVAHAIVLFILMWRELGGLRGYGLGATFAKTLLASAGMGGVLWALGHSLDAQAGEAGLLGLILWVGFSGAVGLGVYAGLLLALGVPEVRSIRPWAQALWEGLRSR